MASIKKNSLMSFIRAFSATVVPILTFPYLSRVLGPGNLGKIAFSSSIINYLLLIAAFGIPVYGIRAVAQSKGNNGKLKTTVSDLFAIHLLITSVVVLVFFAICPFVGKIHNEWALFLVTSTMLVFNTMSLDWYYQGMEEYSYITIRSIAFSIIGVIAMFALVKNKDDYVISASITSATFAGSAIVNIWNARKLLSGKFSVLQALSRHIKPLAIAYIMNFFTSIYLNMDMIFLGFISDSLHVGYYSASTRILKISFGLMAAVSSTLSPRLSYYAEKKMSFDFDKLIEKSVAFTLLISVPAVFGIIQLGKEFILVLAGEKYLESYSSLVASAPVLIFSSLSNILAGQILYPKNREKEILCSVVLGAVVSLLLNVVLISKFQHIGAAIAMLSSEVVVCMILMPFAKKETKGLHLKASRAIKLIISVTSMALAVAVVKSFIESPLIRIIIGVPTGAFVFFSSIWILKDELLFSSMTTFLKRRKNE